MAIRYCGCSCCRWRSVLRLGFRYAEQNNDSWPSERKGTICGICCGMLSADTGQEEIGETDKAYSYRNNNSSFHCSF